MALCLHAQKDTKECANKVDWEILFLDPFFGPFYPCAVNSRLCLLPGGRRDAYFMRKDFDKVVATEVPAQPQPQQRQRRRGEKERNEWLNRDATGGGSFFDNRKSMRETLSEEELLGIDPIMSGH